MDYYPSNPCPSSLYYKFDISSLDQTPFPQYMDTAFTPIKLSQTMNSDKKDPFSYLKTQPHLTSPSFITSSSQKQTHLLQVSKCKNLSSFETAFESTSPLKASPHKFSFSSSFQSRQHLTHKRKRIRFISAETKHKTKYFLNEITVNGFSLANFPFINVNEDEYAKLQEITLLTALEKKKMYFTTTTKLNNNNNNNSVVCYDDIQIDERVLKENNIYFYEGETSVKEIIINFYTKIKQTLYLIEENYIKHKTKILNENNLLKLELLIRNCNLFTNYIKANATVQTVPCNGNSNNNNTTRYRNKKANHSKQLNCNNDNGVVGDSEMKFKCDYCNKTFKNGQALGGHISQLHPKQSEKYRKKVEIRMRRTKQRGIILECRKLLLERHGFCYEELIKKKMKHIIKEVIKENNNEYKRLLMKMKKEHKEGGSLEG